MKEPDRKIPFAVKALLALLAAIPLYYGIQGWNQTARVLAILIFTYLVTRVLSRDLVHFPGWFYRLIVRVQDGKLQGKLYMFDEVRVHLFLIDDEAWIAADAVKALLHPNDQERMMLGKGYGKIPGTKVAGYREGALFQLIAKRQRAGGGRDVTRLEKWLRDDALPNLRRYPSSSL
jgi:hypothetical protein